MKNLSYVSIVIFPSYMVGLPMHDFNSEDCEALILRTAMDECGIHGPRSTVYGLRSTVHRYSCPSPEHDLHCIFSLSM